MTGKRSGVSELPEPRRFFPLLIERISARDNRPGLYSFSVGEICFLIKLFNRARLFSALPQSVDFFRSNRRFLVARKPHSLSLKVFYNHQLS